MEKLSCSQLMGKRSLLFGNYLHWKSEGACRVVWHMALGPLTPVIGRSHSLVFWLRPVTAEKTASEMVFTSLRAMPRVTQCFQPHCERLQRVLVLRTTLGVVSLGWVLLLGEAAAKWTDGKKRKYCHLTHVCESWEDEVLFVNVLICKLESQLGRWVKCMCPK